MNSAATFFSAMPRRILIVPDKFKGSLTALEAAGAIARGWAAACPGDSLVLMPMVGAVYGISFKLGIMPLLGILALGSAAISAPGTLYAAMAVQARARDALLPLLLFPIVVPALLGSVKATTLVIEGDPMGQLSGWVTLLVVFVTILC